MARFVPVYVSLLCLAAAASPAAAGSTYQYEDYRGCRPLHERPRGSPVLLRPEGRGAGSPPRSPWPSGPGGSPGPPRLRPRDPGGRGTLRRRHPAGRGVVQTESAGNPTAVSPKGARGLMQLMPERAALLGVRDSFDPHQNVDGGVRHIRDLLQSFGGDVTLALAAYNAGEGAVRSYGGVPPFAETREYVRRVRVPLRRRRVPRVEGGRARHGAPADLPQPSRKTARSPSRTCRPAPPRPSAGRL